MENATHRVTYNGETRFCSPDNYEEVVDELIQIHGREKQLKFEKLTGKELVKNLQEELDKTVNTITTSGEEISNSGKLRSQFDEQQALDHGFSPAAPLYSIGTKVDQTGVANARKSQLQHEAKPSAIEVANQLVKAVQAEKRHDVGPYETGKLRMDKTGRLVLPGRDGTYESGIRRPLTPRAFDSIFGRFPCASGSSYLKSCPTKLRSINFNHWAVETEAQGKDNQTVLRMRQGSAGPEVFACVSPTYTAFDADKIGAALAKAFPQDAKGVLDYTGERLRVEGIWHTDVQPEDFVAGEFFKAGVIVRSDDTGSGSIRVQSVLWRNLCLNLIILDRAIGVDIRLKHTGSVEALARRFRQAFSKALNSVEPFRRSWSWAKAERDEKLIERVQGTTSEDLSKLPATAVLPGIFNGILERDLVPVKGRRKDIVPQLMEMHTQDEAAEAYGVSRASIVNAFTRYAHVREEDSFAADEIRTGAGALLSGKAGRTPAPLPYVPITI